MAELASFLPLIAIALLFWLMVIRPASRRQKKLAQMQSELTPGQRVMLSSGILGTVRSVADDRARIQVADGVEIEVVRAAVGSVVDEPTADRDPDTATPQSEQDS